jgi:opacity protein-like surface antigen
MKTCILASVGVCVVLTSAVSAADLPVLKAPIATSSFSWTGLYFGLHAGGAWNNADWFYPSTALNAVAGAPVSTPFNVSGGNHSAFGGIAGGQIGYNY